MAKSGKKSGLLKFFEDYPIVLIIAVVFGLGAWVGYGLAQKHVGHPQSAQSVLESKLFKKNAFAEQIPVTGVPIVPPQKLVEQPVEEVKTPQPANKPAEKPRIVFVIDDVGYNKRYADLLFSINPPVTCAILPQITYSKYFAQEAKKHGFEAILHLPLEPDPTNEDPGPGLIKVDMNPYEIKTILEKDLASVPGVVGVNNHMGSKATRDRAVMYFVLKELKERQLFFLDSMTRSDSVAHEVAFAMGLPPLKRDIFLDNKDDSNYVTQRIQEAAKIAKQTGFVIAIGHYREKTLSAIKKAIPGLQAEGFEIIRLKDLM